MKEIASRLQIDAQTSAETLHWQFEAQVIRTPNSIAVVCDDESVTYQELNERANQLAHYLIDLGIVPGCLVPLCVERSINMLVAILAILKAAGAYVPLNPSDPRERLAIVLEDTNARIVLSEEGLLADLPQGSIHVICLDRDWPAISAHQHIHNPRCRLHIDSLCYVIYTSGSTGQPKGVLISHGNVSRLFQATQEWFDIDDRDVWSLFHSYAFDFSVWEIWGALLHGGRLVVVPQLVARSPDAFWDLLSRERVTVLNQTPSSFQQLMHVDEAYHDPSGLETLSLVILGGEALDPGSLRPWFRAHGDLQPLVVNMYGITETTVHVTYRPLAVQDAQQPRGSLIGEPIPDLHLYILNSYMNPIPTGVQGELYIGGPGLSRGYLQRPDVTAERFVPNPFSSAAGDRLYRSGDLGRFLDDGDVEYLGRADHQVKLRGFRIELGEIESVLKRHPSVREVIIGVQQRAEGDKRLIAYVVPKAEDQDAAVGFDELAAEQVAQWQTIFDDTYASGQAEGDETFNIAGWNSSYTGQPLPDAEMKEWVDRTVERVSALGLGRVLEIGCGTGLLLFRLAPLSSEYVGTDFSTESLAYVRGHLELLGEDARKVSLLERAANEFAYTEANSFDCVVINSVAQYFPSVGYLLEVMEGAVNAVSEGGTIFVGDVRSLPLLRVFHAWVQHQEAGPQIPLDQQAENVRKQVALEDELVIDPAFFVQLKEHMPRIGRVEVKLKHSEYANELTKFRYDVVLHICKADDAPLMVTWHDWGHEGLTPEALRRRLMEQEPAVFAVECIPNGRVVEDVRALALLDKEDSRLSAEEPVQAVESVKTKGIDPERLWSIETELPYSVELSWVSCPDDGSYRALFVRRTRDIQSHIRCWDTIVRSRTATWRPWHSYANFPMQGALAHRLLPRLKGFLKEFLPPYMIPGAFIFLDKLPLTPNGKVDRKALPSPEGQRPGIRQRYIAPQTETHRIMAGIWGEVLGIEQVGVEDNFFELGGHSLLATQVISRIRQLFSIDVSLRTLFESPTIAGMAEEIGEQKGPEQEVIQVRNRPESMPLSYAQERLWFLDQLVPDNPFYNMPAALRLGGPINFDTLEQAVSEIIRRHETLRTAFRYRCGNPTQEIKEPEEIRIPVVDVSAMTEEEGRKVSEEIVNQEILEPFNLRTGPMIRARIVRIADQDHILTVTLHHIASDGWSMGVLTAEMSNLYLRFSGGHESEEPDLKVQYADFAIWQREWLQGQELERQMKYWRERLSGIPVLCLPSDRPRPVVSSYRGASHPIDLGEDLSQSLRQQSRTENVTLFMLLLAAFKVLLMRFTGQEDIAVGIPIANRNRKEIEGLIGFFVNSLVIRTDLSGDPTYKDVLARVRERALEAYAHQDLPFEKLVEELQPERDLSRNPLFQIMFAVQNAPSSQLKLGNLVLGPGPANRTTTRFDIEVHLWEQTETIRGFIIYSTDLYDPETIDRLESSWEIVLRAIIDGCTESTWARSLLTEIDRRQLIEWNSTETEYPQEGTLSELFEEQAEKTADAVAALYEGEHLTYRQLDERSNQIGHYLRSFGAAPETLIAICFERSLAMLEGLMGVLKSGAAYMPLDPAYPKDRKAFMLQDAGVQILITQSSLEELLPAFSGRVIALDRDCRTIQSHRAEQLEKKTSAPNLAYVIYTSGSTGKPKGAMIEHRQVTRLFAATRDSFNFGNDDIWTLFHSYAFDFSVWELWGALLHGGRLVVVPYLVSRAPEPFYGLLCDEGVTVLNQTPSAFRQLIPVAEAPDEGSGLALRLVIFGGGGA